MKKTLLVILMLSFSIQSFADCRTRIDSSLADLKAQNGQVNQNLLAGGALGAMLIVVSAPVGLTIAGLVGVGSGIHEIRKNNLMGLQAAINQAYDYQETSVIGAKLKKLHRKVKNKLRSEVSLQDLVDAIIAANENEDLCRAQNINRFAKKIVVELE